MAIVCSSFLVSLSTRRARDAGLVSIRWFLCFGISIGIIHARVLIQQQIMSHQTMKDGLIGLQIQLTP